MRARGWLVLILSVMMLMVGLVQARAEEPRLLVFAAASTTNALEDLGRDFGKAHGVEVLNSFASSSTLAKQIAGGAPAQVYVSANVKWMDYLEKKGDLVPGTRIDILKNRLVLIAPKDSPQGPIDLAKGADLATLLADGRLAMGDPGHVPAGIYGRQALTSLGQWQALESKVAATANVRAALALVASGEAPLGVVYATDAAISDKVKVVAKFPEGGHDPIVYPAALVAGHDTPTARAYLKFLGSEQAAAVFTKYGFQPTR